MLDSDHLTELGFRSAPGQRLSKRLGRSDLPAVIPIVSFQEQMAGILSRINQIKSASFGELALSYESLANITDFLAGFTSEYQNPSAATSDGRGSAPAERRPQLQTTLAATDPDSSSSNPKSKINNPQSSINPASTPT